MVWFWQSPPRSPVEGKPAPSSAQSETQTPPKTSPAQDDSSMDPEIARFLAQFQAELNGAARKPAARAGPSSSWFSLRPNPPAASQDPSSSSNTSAPSGATSSAQITAAAAAEPSGPEAMAASIEPAPSSCRQAFDLAFHCNGLGGQWNAVYRYGGLRNCSDQWDDFWFCMRVKSHSPELRAAAYRRRQRDKDLARYGPGMPSSEDVWVSRDRKVEPGTEFVTPMPELDADFDSVEWSRAENERRRRIREGLGFVDKGPQAGAA